MARVVVVGGGISGLAGAARLATKGHKVTVLEQSNQLGGLVRSYYHGGFTFDLGPTTLTLPAVYRDLFLKTGASLEDSVDLLEVPDGRRYHWADGSSVLIPSVGGTRAARALATEFGERANEDWRGLIARAGQMWRIIRPQLLEQQLRSVKDLEAVTASRTARRTLAPKVSLRKLARKLIKDQRVRRLVEDYALAFGADPRRAPGTQITAPYIEQTFGTWRIGGGMSKLVDALQARCIERGVEILTNSEVISEVREDGKTVGVLLHDQSTVAADLVVRSDLGASNPSRSVFTLLLAMQGTTQKLAHENVFLSSDLDAELNQLDRGELATDPTIRISVPRDSAMHPPHHEAWTIHVTVPLHVATDTRSPWPGIDWKVPVLATNYAELVLDRLQAHGINARDRLLWHEIRTPADIESETGKPGGSAFGAVATDWRTAWLKPPVVAGTEGLFRVGDAVQPGAGLARVGMGAEILAETIGRANRRAKRTSK